MGGWAAHLDENHTPSTRFEEGGYGDIQRENRRTAEAIKSPRTGLRLPVPRLIGGCLDASCDRLRSVQAPREEVWVGSGGR